MSLPSAGADYRPRFERRFLAPRWWPSWIALAGLWVLTQLPRAVRHGLGAFIGRLVFRAHGKRRDIVEVNLAWCFPELDAAARRDLARRYFVRLAQTLLDYGLLWWASDSKLDRLIAIDGEEHLDACRAAGRPVILLTGHGVALDFGGLAITRRHPTVGLVKPARHPIFEWLMSRGRTRFRGRLFSRDVGIRPVVRAIRDGAIFYYLPDEDLGATHQSVFAPFFGVPTATLTALGRLARLTGAAVLPCMTYYLPGSGRYQVRIGAPLEGFPVGDDRADTARMNRELEALIRACPDQYMWSLRLFQTRPDGEPSPYG
ncbi:MAG: lysophospholipid acyltransferase family protein [Gammaproteobacteria bacterium]